MNYNPITFSRNLVKGRIAETLFEQMLRDAGCFTILSFGYENIIPELAHRQQDMRAQETLEIIRRAPDFAVINNNTHDVSLIEVKYLMSQHQKQFCSRPKECMNPGSLRIYFWLLPVVSFSTKRK